MTRRSYNRRSDDQIINELQDRIKLIERRIEAKVRTDSPVLKEIPKMKRALARFAQLCMDHRRNDLSNTVLAFMTTLELQARQAPSEGNSTPRSRAAAEVV
jgi:hypothetical protein